MSTNVPIYGPGSQPAEADGANLDILQLPSGMDTYAAPILPEADEIHGIDDALALLNQLQQALVNHASHPQQPTLSLDELDPHNCNLVDQVLGEGEVSVMINAGHTIQIQESVLAGVWRIRTKDNKDNLLADEIEVGPIPQRVIDFARQDAKLEVTMPETLADGVINAPSLVSELDEQVKLHSNPEEKHPDHVINLTLLPQSPDDLDLLQYQLGPGKVSILSRGYGNCRITSTGTLNVWWVQYFNSQDANILNSLEVSEIPNVACAAPEDIADSAQRLQEILEIYQ